MINNKVIKTLTGCNREDIRKETLTGGALPGKIIIRKGNEYLCVEDQSYHDGTIPTAVPKDYVLVTVA